MSSNREYSAPSHGYDYSLITSSFSCCNSVSTLAMSRYPNNPNRESSQPNVNGAYSSTSYSSSSQYNNLGHNGQVNQQPFHSGQYPTSSTSSSNTTSSQLPTCPYHTPFLSMSSSQTTRGQGLSPMDRFMAEGPSEQSALFNRADTGKTSTWRECTCFARGQNGAQGAN